MLLSPRKTRFLPNPQPFHLDADARARSDGGNRTLDYFYDGGRLAEVRNSYDRAVAQHLCGPSGYNPVETCVHGRRDAAASRLNGFTVGVNLLMHIPIY